MTAVLQKMLDQARNLSEEDRITLLLALMEQLTPVKSDAELLTPKLKTQLDGRIADIASNPGSGIPMEAAHKRIRESLRPKSA